MWFEPWAIPDGGYRQGGANYLEFPLWSEGESVMNS